MKYTKDICLLLLFWAGSLLNITAQKTFRVYNSDGSMGVFFYSALDSITFTASDEMDASLIQNIHTPDSTYSFKTCDIDSVSFCSVPTVFKPAVMQLEGTLRDYVVGSESLTLLLKPTVPKSILPKIGSDIATLDCDEVLPNGFIGKVENIVFGADDVRVICGKTSLLDVFESLSIEESFASEEQDSEASTRSPLDLWPAKHFDLVIPSIRGEISLSHEDEMGLNFSSSYDMTAFAELSTEKCDLNIAYFITPMAFQDPQVYFSMSYYAKSTFSIGASVCASFKWEKEMSVFPIKKVVLPGPVGALLDFLIDGGAYVGFEGSLGVNGQFTKPFTTVMQYVYDNKAETPISPVFKMIGGKAESETTLEGDASVSIGLYGKIGVAPKGLSEMAEIDAGFKTGITISTATEFPTDIPPIDAVNTKIYDALDRDDYFRGDFFLTGEFSAEMLESKVLDSKLEVGDIVAANPVFTKGIVPHFSDVELMKGENANSLCASAKVSRNLMFNTNVGLALYDEDNHLVDKWWSPIEYKDNEGEVISYCFEGLSTEASYKLHPITRLFKDNLVANPSADCNLKPYIITGDAKNITSSLATLCARVEIEDDVEYTAGFYYFDSDGEKIEVSTNGRGNQSLEFNATDLRADTEYKYNAFVKIGDYIENGEESTFKTLGIGSGVQIIPSTLTDISSYSVGVSFNILSGSYGNTPYTAGVYYYNDGGDLLFGDEAVLRGSLGIAQTLRNLNADTKYSCICYVKIEDKIIYSEPLIFRTLRIDDAENPIFKCTQQNVNSSSESISTEHVFEEATGGISGKYIIHPTDCFITEGRATSILSSFKLGKIISERWYPSGKNVNYEQHIAQATGEKFLVVKYALSGVPEEWYFTKVPIDMLYDAPPMLLSYRAYNNAWPVDCGVEYQLQGSYWISSVIVEAQLWDKVSYTDEYGYVKYRDVFIEERTFTLSTSEGYSFRDGNNLTWLYPAGSTNCEWPYVKILNVTMEPKQ